MGCPPEVLAVPGGVVVIGQSGPSITFHGLRDGQLDNSAPPTTTATT